MKTRPLTPADHYRIALDWLDAEQDDEYTDGLDVESKRRLRAIALTKAQIHATLALYRPSEGKP